MLIRIICLCLSVMLFCNASISLARHRFSESLCHRTDYICLKIHPGDSWSNLFTDEQEQDIVKRINRMNIRLQPGMVIAVPKNLDRLTIYDVAPFPRYIQPSRSGEKTIFIDQNTLAWAAYSSDGEMVWWGPISSGSGRCINQDGNCQTPTGEFRVIRKQDIDCISTVFPMRANGENGGAEMPYCMHFLRGFALHGSSTLPGYRDSHGCVRLFIEDARWLNEEFIELPGAGGLKGTRIIVNSVQT